MGHNGGFNPYRDQNGEFATPQQAGKPGRKRAGTVGGGGGGGAAAPAGRARTAPNALRGAKKVVSTTPGSPEDRPSNPGIGYRGSRPLTKVPRDLAGHVREAQRLTKQYGKGVSKSGRSALSKADKGGAFVSPPQKNDDGSHTVYRHGEHEVRVQKGFARSYRNGQPGNSVNTASGGGIASQVAGVKGTVRNEILASQGRAPHSGRVKGTFHG
jgi:hypothetical protein